MQAQSKVLNFEGQNIYVGLNVHLNSWNTSIYSENLYNKTLKAPPRSA